MEIWKDIEWYEWLYQVSNMWNIKSLNYNRTWKEKILKWSSLKNWYKWVALSKDKKINTFLIHRLVWLTFLQNKENKKQINHKNWIRIDNRVKNLEWMTCSENILHKYHILWYKGSFFWRIWKLHPSSKKVNQYTKEWEFIKTWDCIKDVYRELKISKSYISKVCKWKRKTAWWFIWKYF